MITSILAQVINTAYFDTDYLKLFYTSADKEFVKSCKFAYILSNVNNQVNNKFNSMKPKT